MNGITEWAPLLNVVLFPVAIWIVKLERRLTRIETILEIKFKKKEDRRKC